MGGPTGITGCGAGFDHGQLATVMPGSKTMTEPAINVRFNQRRSSDACMTILTGAGGHAETLREICVAEFYAQT
jgi:hypothetical protein